jgi:hypothetical protein
MDIEDEAEGLLKHTNSTRRNALETSDLYQRQKTVKEDSISHA